MHNKVKFQSIQLFFSALVAALLVSGCDIADEIGKTFLFRQSIVYEHAGKQYLASGVVEKTLYVVKGAPGAHGVHETNTGEGLAVEIPGVGYIVTTFIYPGEHARGGGSRNLISESCGVPPLPLSSNSGQQWITRIDSKFADKCSVSKSVHPLTIVFKEPSDPLSATAYDPNELPDGLTVQAYTITRTTDAVTFGSLLPIDWSRSRIWPQPRIPLAGHPGVDFALERSLFVQGEPE